MRGMNGHALVFGDIQFLYTMSRQSTMSRLGRLGSFLEGRPGSGAMPELMAKRTQYKQRRKAPNVKIHLLSDLHLDHLTEPLVIPLPACDVRIVAGDMCEFGQRDALAAPFLRRLVAGKAPVLVILGNHDHYRGGSGTTAPAYESRVASWQKTCASAGARLLERDSIIVGNHRILGCTWWSAIDWNDDPNHRYRHQFASDAEFVRHGVELGISDFRLIRKWSVADHLRRHEQDTAWLTDALADTKDGRKPIVLTHFLPHKSAIDAQFRGSCINTYFTTHRPDLVRQAHVWLFGHTHSHVDLLVDGVRLVANPRGYPNERSGFVPDLVIEV